MPSSITTKNKTSPGEQGASHAAALWHRLLIGAVILVACVTAFSAYASILNIGFLLDDFSHLSTAYAAGRGNFAPLLKTFSSNWTGTADNLTSYRPLISLSFCLDYLFWNFHAYGYHLTNIIMFAGCVTLTSLLAYELSAQSGQVARLLCASAAGLLYAVYPLHPEAVAWIIGRVDVQCGLFYLAALYFYLCWRRTLSQRFLAISFVASACALPSKEMAVTLPVSILLAELLLPAKTLGWAELTLKKKASVIGGYFGLLIIFAVVRSLAIGTVIGGYGGSHFKAIVRSLQNFADKDTWAKVLLGVNGEVTGQPDLTSYAGWCGWSFALLLLLRLRENNSYWRIMAFLVSWAVVSELPTYQIWHVFPNLCGSRLLYLPSSSLCIVLALVAVSSYRCLELVKSKLVGALPLVVGTITVSALSILWYAALQINLLPWNIAGESMTALTDQVRLIASGLDSKKLIVLLDLPQDVAGAGMLGRPEFLNALLSPPLYPLNISDRVVATERPIPGAFTVANPHMLEDILRQPSVHQVLLWNQKERMYVNWVKPKGDKECHWQGKLKSDSGGITWLPVTNIDPFAVQALTLKCNSVADDKTQWQLVFRSQNQPKSWIDYSEGPKAQRLGNQLVFFPARYRSWLYNGSIVQIGLKAADAKDQTFQIDGGSDAAYVPTLTLQNASQPSTYTPTGRVHSRWLMPVSAGDKIQASFDASTITGAKQVVILVANVGTIMGDTYNTTLPSPKSISARVVCNSTKGTVTLPDSITHQPGVHQIAAVALDSNDKVIGLMSEPDSISCAAVR